MERTRHVAPQLVGLNPPFAQREVRAGARPQRPLVGTGDRHEEGPQRRDRFELGEQPERPFHAHRRERRAHKPYPDRKSTRLNSSHSQKSYAVFCFEKKKTTAYVEQSLHTV